MAVTYGSLTESERWAWHAEVYAFRHVVLKLDERVSPCDPDGRWYDDGLVGAATLRLTDKRDGPKRRRRAAADAEMRSGGRELCNRWARNSGFPDFAAAERAGHEHNDVVGWVIAHATKHIPAEPRSRWDASAFGVTAREYKPTADQLSAGRRALGLDDTEIAS